MFHEKIDIGGKDVYIVESHHHVLQSWAEIRRSLSAAPALVTLDHHTDTYEPFLRHRYHATHRTPGDDEGTAMAAMLPGMIAELRYDDEGSVLDAIGKLYNDEHVRMAIMAGIVSRGFVVNRTRTIASPASSTWPVRSVRSTAKRGRTTTIASRSTPRRCWNRSTSTMSWRTSTPWR
jgi:hypothetical protein